jgi:hypothetical protein
MIADYLGQQRIVGSRPMLLFSLRPKAGTTAVPLAWVKDIYLVSSQTQIQLETRI